MNQQFHRQLNLAMDLTDLLQAQLVVWRDANGPVSFQDGSANIGIDIREAADMDNKIGVRLADDLQDPEVMDLHGVCPGLYGYCHNLSELRQAVVARCGIRSDVCLLPSALHDRDRFPQVIETLQQVALVQPAGDVAKVDGIIGAQIRLGQVPQIRDSRVQFKRLRHCLSFILTPAYDRQVTGASSSRTVPDKAL